MRKLPCTHFTDEDTNVLHTRLYKTPEFISGEARFQTQANSKLLCYTDGVRAPGNLNFIHKKIQTRKGPKIQENVGLGCAMKENPR